VTGNAPSSGDASTEEGPELPEDVVEEAERLTRLAREATDEDERAAYRADRDERLAEYGFLARVRREDAREVLVCHPEEWVEDGTIRPDRVEDLDRAVEVRLSGAGDPDEWDEVDDHNRALAEEVREEHGSVHGANAEALAEFMSNHYAKRISTATGNELREFLEEYFPRNAWPSEEQRAVVGESVELTFEAADEPLPEF
jgi:hypothetical protein